MHTHKVEMANQAPTYRVNYVGSQGVVTVNNGSGNPSSGRGQVNQTPAVRHVTVTPLITTPTAQVTSARSPRATSTLCTLLIKAVRKGERKDCGKIFTLRNVNPMCVSKVEDLKSLIKAQLSGDLVDRFDVGYIQSNKVVSLWSKEDIGYLMGSVLKGDKVLLWCDGLGKEPKKAEKNTCKRRAKTSMIDSSDSDDEEPPSKHSKKVDRDAKVQRCVEDLKEKHGQSAYTPIQYRIWAELLIEGCIEAPLKRKLILPCL